MSHQKVLIEVKKILFNLPLSERITLIERLGKQLRQQNNREISKEVEDFKKKQGLGKKIDHYSILEK